MVDSVIEDLSDIEDAIEGSTPRKRKCYSNEFKLKVIKHAKDISKKSASETFQVAWTIVIDLVKQADKLKVQA